MKFSIVIPCYNAESYLPRLFKTLDALIFNKEQYEVILVDDGSKDNTFTLLCEYATEKPNFIVVTQANAGVAVARNQGLTLASGDWIVFLDCDDWFNNNYFYELNEAIKQYPNSSCYFSHIARYYEQSKRSKILKNSCPESVKLLYRRKRRNSQDPDDRDPGNKDPACFNLAEYSFNFYRTAQRIAFNRQVLNAYQVRFKAGIKYGEDMLFHWEYMVALFQLAKGDIPEGLPENEVIALKQLKPLQACFVPQAIYYYFRSKSEESRVTDRRQTNQLSSMFNTYAALYQVYQKLADYHEGQLLFLRELMPHLGASLIYALWDSSNLLSFDNKTKVEFAVYTLLYRKWLELYQQHNLTRELVETTAKVGYYPQVRAQPLFLFLLKVAAQPQYFTQLQSKLLLGSEQAEVEQFKQDLASYLANLAEQDPLNPLCSVAWQSDLTNLTTLTFDYPSNAESVNQSDPILLPYTKVKYFVQGDKLQLVTNLRLGTEALAELKQICELGEQTLYSEYKVLEITVGYLYTFDLSQLSLGQIRKLGRFWSQQDSQAKSLATVFPVFLNRVLLKTRFCKWLKTLSEPNKSNNLSSVNSGVEERKISSLALCFTAESRELIKQASEALAQNDPEVSFLSPQLELNNQQESENNQQVFSFQQLANSLLPENLSLVTAESYLSKSGLSGLWRYYVDYPRTEIIVMSEADFTSRSKQQSFLQRSYPLAQFVIVRRQAEPISAYLQALYASYPNLCLLEIA